MLNFDIGTRGGGRKGKGGRRGARGFFFFSGVRTSESKKWRRVSSFLSGVLSPTTSSSVSWVSFHSGLLSALQALKAREIAKVSLFPSKGSASDKRGSFFPSTVLLLIHGFSTQAKQRSLLLHLIIP